MARYEFDCGRCTNVAYSERYAEMYGYGGLYCLPTISTGESPIVFHDMGGSRQGDYLTCGEYTVEPRTVAIYEAVSVYTPEHPGKEWRGYE